MYTMDLIVLFYRYRVYIVDLGFHYSQRVLYTICTLTCAISIECVLCVITNSECTSIVNLRLRHRQWECPLWVELVLPIDSIKCGLSIVLRIECTRLTYDGIIDSVKCGLRLVLPIKSMQYD